MGTFTRPRRLNYNIAHGSVLCISYMLRRWCRRLERWPACARLGVRISTATHQFVKAGSDSPTAKRLASSVIARVIGDDLYKRMSSFKAKETTLVNGQEYRV